MRSESFRSEQEFRDTIVSVDVVKKLLHGSTNMSSFLQYKKLGCGPGTFASPLRNRLFRLPVVKTRKFIDDEMK